MDNVPTKQRLDEILGGIKGFLAENDRDQPWNNIKEVAQLPEERSQPATGKERAEPESNHGEWGSALEEAESTKCRL
jgi:hypothetical protein